MKSRAFYVFMVAGGVALLALAKPEPISGQNPPPAEVSPKLLALIRDVKLQNEQLAENQAQMDERIDKISELVRQARIFAARSGGGKGGAK